MSTSLPSDVSTLLTQHKWFDPSQTSTLYLYPDYRRLVKGGTVTLSCIDTPIG